MRRSSFFASRLMSYFRIIHTGPLPVQPLSGGVEQDAEGYLTSFKQLDLGWVRFQDSIIILRRTDPTTRKWDQPF